MTEYQKHLEQEILSSRKKREEYSNLYNSIEFFPCKVIIHDDGKE